MLISSISGLFLLLYTWRFKDSPERTLEIVERQLQTATIPQLLIIECIHNEYDSPVPIVAAAQISAAHLQRIQDILLHELAVKNSLIVRAFSFQLSENVISINGPRVQIKTQSSQVKTV